VIAYGVGYPHRLNGAQRSLLNLLVGLRERSYRPVVVFSGPGRCVDAYAQEGLDVRVLDVPPAFREYGKAWMRRSYAAQIGSAVRGLPGVAGQVRALVRSEGAALLHVNDPRALLVFGWGARLARRPVVLHVRGALGQYPVPLRFLTQLLPRRLILVGEGIRPEIAPPFRSKTRVIYDSVELEPAEDAAERDGSSPTRPLTVLTLASFDPFKGYHHLAAAARMVTEELGRDGVRFVWVGDDEIDPEYAAFVRSSVDGLENVEIHRWVADVRPFLVEADLVVQPTVEQETLELPGRTIAVHSGEGVPRALMEAMAFGTATVGSSVGGIPEAIEHGRTGLLVPPSDASALAVAIVQLLRAPDVRARMGQQGLELARARFSEQSYVEQTIALYDELLSS
jgi:glycosyltransferase involved in cell wall biosynthesis